MNNIEEKYFSSLNEQQRRAVQSVDGATLLLAVPGSGKTTVLIKRLGYMINCKCISPEEILVVTYTVSATKDMKNRYISYFGEENADRIEFRTINGICAKILYQFEKQYGKELFKLADEKTINNLLIKIILKYEKS
nr:UvrD-helicase domain-containing protein [Lachnospiraceae bacterium]